MNARGIAPYFRDAKSGVFSKTGLTPQQIIESNDRQIIDLHWLHTQHRELVKTRDYSLKYLFAEAEFDFHLASEFVRRPMKTVDKARKLGISSQIQAELLTIKTADVRKLQSATKRQAERAEVLLRDRVQNPRSRFPESNFDSSCIAFKCLALGNGSLLTAAYYWNLADIDNSMNEKQLYEFMNKSKKFFEQKLKYSPWKPA